MKLTKSNLFSVEIGDRPTIYLMIETTKETFKAAAVNLILQIYRKPLQFCTKFQQSLIKLYIRGVFPIFVGIAIVQQEENQNLFLRITAYIMKQTRTDGNGSNLTAKEII